MSWSPQSGLLDQTLIEFEILRLADSDLREIRMSGIHEKNRFFLDDGARNGQNGRLRRLSPRITQTSQVQEEEDRGAIGQATYHGLTPPKASRRTRTE